MAKLINRFTCVNKQEFYTKDKKVMEIWVDRETGVNYILVQMAESCALTPLLGTDGRPVVTQVSP